MQIPHSVQAQFSDLICKNQARDQEFKTRNKSEENQRGERDRKSQDRKKLVARERDKTQVKHIRTGQMIQTGGKRGRDAGGEDFKITHIKTAAAVPPSHQKRTQRSLVSQQLLQAEFKTDIQS